MRDPEYDSMDWEPAPMAPLFICTATILAALALGAFVHFFC